MVRKHNSIPLKCATSKNISNKENKDDKEEEGGKKENGKKGTKICDLPEICSFSLW
jgi:hypothetical protein